MANNDPELRRYYLSLGSNIRPEENLRAAVLMLDQYGKVLAYAPLYSSPSFGDESQPDYLNTAVLIESSLTPNAFQEKVIGSIEAALGRTRSENRFAARTIDIDILLVGHEVLRIGHRSIPSPELLVRPFVAIPMAALAPDFIHPTDGRSLAEIAAAFPSDSVLRGRGDWV